MRGRTNVMQRKDPTINGLIRNFTVATGNTIAKGDFVSYSLQTDTKNVTDVGNHVNHRVYNAQNNLYLGVYKNRSSEIYYLALIDVSNDFEVLDTISFAGIPCYEIDNNGNIYVGYETDFYVYQIQNSRFVLFDNVSVTKRIVAVLKANENNEYLVITMNDIPSNAHYTNFNGHKITLSESSVSLGTEELVYQGASVYNQTTFFYCGYLSDGIFTIIWQFPYVSGQSGTAYCLAVKYANGVYTPTLKTLFYISGSNYGITKCEYIGEIFFIKNRMYARIYGVVNDSIEILKEDGIESYNTVYNVNEEYFIVTGSGSTNCILNKYDKQTKVFSRGSELVGSLQNGSADFYLKGSNLIVQRYFGNAKLFSFDDETLDLANGYFGNVVEEYNGNYTVGFAKTSGNAGDTIQVYVPSLSS